MFISFEGIDGSGKSTQARLLTDTLRRWGHSVVEVREPGGTLLGERIRSLLLDPAHDVHARAELLLFSAARAQLVAHVIAPSLEEGKVVIADRFIDSSTAYQGAGRGVASPEWLATLHGFATAGLVPVRTYLIDVPVETATSRRVSTEADRMEAAGLDFYRRVREGYLRIAASSPERVLKVDGTRDPEAVNREILADVQALLSAATNKKSPATNG